MNLYVVTLVAGGLRKALRADSEAHAVRLTLPWELDLTITNGVIKRGRRKVGTVRMGN